MRGDIVYRVQARAKAARFGTHHRRSDAEAEVVRLLAREDGGHNWAEQHYPDGFQILDVVVETDFEIPFLPAPRGKYLVKAAAGCRPGAPGNPTRVEVFRRNLSAEGLEKICRYERDYGPMFETFEPFRQGGRDLALISRSYEKTAVLDLQSGEVIAEEDRGPGSEDPVDLDCCPAGFYVPDWWDLHDGKTIPGSESWNANHEWPTGDFGFVWGGPRGDEQSHHVQYLDLRRVQQGIILRDERFGALELATRGYTSPCFDPSATTGTGGPPFIRVTKAGGPLEVSFTVEMTFKMWPNS
jgi:hypothetical protein